MLSSTQASSRFSGVSRLVRLLNRHNKNWIQIGSTWVTAIIKQGNSEKESMKTSGEETTDCRAVGRKLAERDDRQASRLKRLARVCLRRPHRLSCMAEMGRMDMALLSASSPGIFSALDNDCRGVFGMAQASFKP